MRNLVGHAVQFVIGNRVVLWGIAEYLRDGWVGIRQVDGRLDEAPLDHVEVDAT